MRLPCPVREFFDTEGNDGKKKLLEDNRALSAPRELMRMLEWLMIEGIGQVSLLSYLVCSSVMECTS